MFSKPWRVTMHSHDRTLLAKLGFQDEDKSNPLHDLACQFLAQDEQASAILKLVFKDQLPSNVVKVGDEYYAGKGFGVVKSISLGLASGETEKLIQKGSGQYATTIGFADVCITFALICEVEKNGVVSEVFLHQGHSDGRGPILCEVKIGQVGVGTIIRQLKLYSGHMPRCSGCVVATPWSFTKPEADTLLKEGITTIKLGPKFEAFVAQAKASSNSTPGLEL
jgi:hypothetical protein